MLDWEIKDDKPAPDLPLPPYVPRRVKRPPRPWRRWQGRAVAVLAVVALLIGAVVWTQLNQRTTQLRADAQAAVDTELLMFQAHNPGLSGWDEQSDRQWQARYAVFVRNWRAYDRPSNASARVQQVELVGADLARVTVETKTVSALGERTTRGVHVYRLVGRQWQRAAPDERSWGAWQSLETHRLHVVYRERDQELAKALAQDFDLFYDRVYADLLVSPPPRDRRLVVSLDVTALNSDPIRTEDGFRIGSPLASLQEMDAGDKPEDIVRWELAKALVILAASDSPIKLTTPWQRVVSAMLGAEARVYAHPPASVNALTANRLRAALADNTFIPLRGLDAQSVNQNIAEAEWQSVGEYIVTRYGVGGPARLLNATRKALTWDDLTIAAFGMTSTEFETAWRAWLRERL